MAISIIDPISSAAGRAKYITFQPFNIGKWFVLGFVAWLATLADGGGGGGGSGFNYSGGRGRPGFGGRGPGFGTWGPTRDVHDFVQWCSANLSEVLVFCFLALLIVVGLGLLITWISSRGHFVFIEAVANNTCAVVDPWRRYRELGNSLFLFRLVLGLIAGTFSLAALAVCLGIAWPDIANEEFGSNAGTAILLGCLLLAPMGIFFAIVDWCTSAFVAPIMYATGQTVLPAWVEFRAVVVTGHFGTLVLFLLMYVLLTIAVGLLSVIVGCVTCCIGFLPYLSTVVTLPLVVFKRCYPIYFLQQFDPRYAIIREPPPPTAFPVMNPGSDQPPWPPGQMG